MIGGPILRLSMVATGTQATEGYANIHADLCFLGVTGLHPDTGLTTGHPEEARLKARMIRSAAETVVLASHEKLNSASAFAIGELGAASTLIVDTTLDEALRQQLTLAGVEILYAL